MKAAIFDMDGLMFDTERLSLRILLEEGSRFGCPFTEEIAGKIRGTNEEKSGEILRGIFGAGFEYAPLRAQCLRRMREEMDQNGVPVKKGLRELLSFLKEEGCKIAVATSTSREDAVHYLKQAEVEPFFDAMVFGDMVKNSKPAPDIYSRAAELIQTPARDCLALEDSPAGILSARCAGMKVIMVPDLAEITPEVERCLYANLPSLLDVRDMLRQRGVSNV